MKSWYSYAIYSIIFLYNSYYIILYHNLFTKNVILGKHASQVWDNINLF